MYINKQTHTQRESVKDTDSRREKKQDREGKGARARPRKAKKESERKRKKETEKRPLHLLRRRVAADDRSEDARCGRPINPSTNSQQAPPENSPHPKKKVNMFIYAIYMYEHLVSACNIYIYIYIEYEHECMYVYVWMCVRVCVCVYT